MSTYFHLISLKSKQPTNILEAKGHDLVAVARELDPKSGLALISRVHTNLIVP